VILEGNYVKKKKLKAWAVGLWTDPK